MKGLFELMEPATPVDFSGLAALARRLAVHHGDAFEPSAEALQADYGTWYRAVLARSADGAVVGFVGWHPIYWIQSAGRAIELQNLFVDPEWRNRKVGLALVRHVAFVSLNSSAAALRIGVRKDNDIAISFYDKIGCTRHDRGANWVCRLDTDQMRKLVNEIDCGT